ncbi:non-structural protein NS4A [Nocardia arthritidis]|uniref:non-structural protein NS4A n=1 Tax=Nocardia arthritidis TaxID=228602 RepID=UPI0014721031|nr:non-structural protein NS4A [Nocardia arthritidis]
MLIALEGLAHPHGGGRAGRSKMGTVSSDVTVIVLFALAGFLLGGAYTTWKTARPLSMALAVCAVLAAGGALARWLG